MDIVPRTYEAHFVELIMRIYYMCVCVYNCSLDLLYFCFNLTNKNITKFSERSTSLVYKPGRTLFWISF